MASIEWARLCETAFLDRHGRLCLIGVVTHFPVPSLPIAVNQLMIAARVIDTRGNDELDVTLSVATPDGLWTAPEDADAFSVEMAGEYLLITLRQMPLTREGAYRFLLSLGGETLVTLDVPVWITATRRHAEVH